MARLTEAALKRLEEARSRAHQLSEELSDPATFGDARRAAGVARGAGQVATRGERHGQCGRLPGQLEKAEGLLRDGADDEMKELAQQEIEEVEPQVDDV